MTCPCFNCGECDGLTNCGGLFCHRCSEELTDEEKVEACERILGEEKEAA